MRTLIWLSFLAYFAVDGKSFAGEAESPRQQEDSKMHPYTHCDGFAGGVRGVTRDRRPPAAEPWREVSFGGKTRRVSVADGYRVMYSYPRTYPFASLKAERSDPTKYGEDKQIVMRHLVELASADGNTELANFSQQGFIGQTLTKKELKGSALGIAQILSDEDSVIVTIFFLNQAPENRNFQTYQEFISLRDGFVRGYIECVAKKKAASAPLPKR
jgi:hypothetical protein